MDSSRAAAECWDQPRLQDILVGEQGEAEGAAAAPRPSEVVIYVASGGEDDDASAAGAGDGGRYPESAGAICGRDGRLLLASRDGEGDTPLHRAARAGNTRTVARLVGLVRGGEAGDARALLRARNAAGETALHEAVRFGDTEMVAALVGGDRELARVVADDGTSPLYLASTWGRHRIAREMHDRDHGLSYSGPDGQNALHAAVLHDREMTRLLLEWNKDLLKQRDVNGSTPMHFAASAADPSLQFTNFVFSASSFEHYSLGSYFLLSQRCLAKLYERMNLTLPQVLRADPSSAFQPDTHGSFPVHVAASADSMASVVVLLTRHPACAGLRDARGRTFLHVAVERRRRHVLKFACRWCQQPSASPVLNAQDGDGNTALHLAVLAGERDIVWCLISNRRVHINLQNREGRTPMDLALGKVQSGFYFGLTAPRRILSMLTFANAQTANRRRDQIEDYNPSLNEEEESSKIREFAQIVGIGSVLVATATFTAAITVPGGVRTPGDVAAAAGRGGIAAPPPAGTPVLSGTYAFDGFVVSNTLAFICSTLATFSLVYCGVAAVDIHRRIKLVSFSLALLLGAARSFCAAFGFSLHLLLSQVDHSTAIVTSVVLSFALLDGLWFLLWTFKDLTVLLSRRARRRTVLRLGTGFVANIIYMFWPYLIIFGYLLLHFQKKDRAHS
ncbi:hypothetical protein PAHAL_3G224500 [Panicum hallii]|uniref:PGG domain-containing protein n=1 Tax=Panicum hallii TaxID=206008 RepID=A0A2T8KJ15_9POAL|nr:hypothetical protein PAHAL_3G224500 [Panicum hallii]